VRARSGLVSLLLAGSAAVALGACSGGTPRSLPHPSKAFCDAAVKYDTAIQKTSNKSQVEQARDQLPLVERMAETAPADVKKAAQTVVDMYRRRAAGDRSVVDSPVAKKAVDDMNRRAGNGCGIYQDQNGGGGI
jgi:hypothetical protein